MILPKPLILWTGDFCFKFYVALDLQTDLSIGLMQFFDSARLSIIVNRVLYGYIAYFKRLQQCDLLSPLLFCITKAVPSRGIKHLIDEGCIW